MSDTPDFDSMTPEEMMEWMESLAKRQGATQGFTTDADLEVDEVSDDDERLQGMGEYKPYGMSDEKWAELQAKEAAEKAARQQQAEAVSEDDVDEAEEEIAAEEEAAQPAAAISGLPLKDDGTPDVDNMTPEQMQEWMESLAKRQGGDQSGFLTSASLEVADVDENDERLQGIGEYKPFGMSDERWAELQAQEAEKKAAAQSQSTAQDTDDEDEEEPVRQPSFEDVFGDDVDMDMEELAFEDEDEIILDDTDEHLPYGEFDEDADFIDLDAEDAEYDEDAEEIEMPSFLQELEGEGDFDDDEEPAPVQNSMSWLETLADDESDEAELDLSMLDDVEELPDLEGVAAQDAEEEVNPMAWLEGLAAASGDDSENIDMASLNDLNFDLDTLTDEGDSDEISDPIEWIESLARDQGANTEELTTEASLEIERPNDVPDDAPGYEPYSFEQGGDVPADVDEKPPASSQQRRTFEPAKLTDPGAWLDELAASSGDTGEEYEEMDAEFAEAQRRGDLTPEQVEKYFSAAFERADQRDIPDYIDMDDLDDEEGAIEPQIPDWLQESMETVPPDEDVEVIDDDVEGEVISSLFSDEAAMEDDLLADATGDDLPEMPDWLKEDAMDDTGDIADIFATIDEEADDADFDEEEAESLLDTSELVLDMNANDDPWIEALETEDSPQLQSWYEEKVREYESGEYEMPAASVTLSAANLPEETALPAGELQAVPVWLAEGANIPAASSEQLSVAPVPDLFGEEEDLEMPGWLQQQVADEGADSGAVPDWLQEEGLDIEADEIPQWLLETIDTDAEEELLALPDTSELTPPEEAAQPQPQPTRAVAPAQASPAPVSAAVDVAAALESARASISDGNIETAVQHYESIVRANQSLDVVTNDLIKITEQEAYKKNPAVHRVLGDSLMRQGQLQQALDTYRRALNML